MSESTEGYQEVSKQETNTGDNEKEKGNKVEFLDTNYKTILIIMIIVMINIILR